MIHSSTQPWPHGDVAIVINPNKRKRLERGATIAVVLAALSFFVLIYDGGPVMTWAKRVSDQEKVQQLEPTMRQLADAGKPEAAIWLGKHFPDTDAWRLAPLVQSGSGEAAFELATITWKSDESEAKRLILLAAERGYAPAVRDAQFFKR